MRATAIAIVGRFDVHRIDELRAAAHNADSLLVDASRTDFIDIHALDALEDLGRQIPVTLVAPSPVVQITLELTGRRVSVETPAGRAA